MGTTKGLIELNLPGLQACFQVDNMAIAEAQTNWVIDGSYSEDCAAGDLTFVPDDNFERTLIELGFDDELDNFVSTANLKGVTELDFDDELIEDLRGIENIVNLEALILLNGAIDTINLSQNTKLQTLRLVLEEKNIESLDIQNNTELNFLQVNLTVLRTIDLSQNTKLKAMNLLFSV